MPYPGLPVRPTCFEKFIKEIQRVKHCQTHALIFKWVWNTILRSVVFGSMFADYPMKHVLLSVSKTWATRDQLNPCGHGEGATVVLDLTSKTLCCILHFF